MEVEVDAVAAEGKDDRPDMREREKNSSVSGDEDLASRHPTYVSPLSANEILRTETSFQMNARPHFIPKLEPLSKKVEELRQKMDEEVRASASCMPLIICRAILPHGITKESLLLERD